MSARRRQRRRAMARGFTLLEIMVAVAILGLALSVILSAQGGLSAGSRTAENQGVAASLARCHMTELEERLLKMGYPETDENEPDKPCCNDQIDPRFKCAHAILKVELPMPNTGGAGDAGLSFAGPTSSAAAGMNPIMNPGGGAGLSLDGGGGLQGMGSNLMTQMGAGGASGMLDMVMGMVYPSLKPMMEMSIRRVSVTVSWREGVNERELAIAQFVTNPQRAFVAGDLMGDAGVPGLSPSGTPAPGASGAVQQTTTGGTSTLNRGSMTR